MNCIPRFATACLLTLSLFAQDKPEGSEGKEAKGGKGGIQATDVESVEGKGEKEGAEGKGGKDGFTLDKRPAVLDARGQCRFDGSVVQKRLMPGQAGTLKLTMIFEGDAVMTSPSAFRLQAAFGGPTIASWTLQPPTPARVAPAFLGQTVYDNWALIEAEVVMPSEARLGEKRSIVLDLEFDLHHGSTGQPLGHFRETVAVPCEVGLPLAAPAAVRTGNGAGGVVAPTPTQGKPASEPEAVPPPANAANMAPGAADVTDRQDGAPSPGVHVEPEAVPGSVPEVEVEGGGVWMLGGGVAVVLIAVILVLQRRPRG